MAYWWVNQGVSYKQERDLGVMWAPLADPNGHPVPHWNTMDDVSVGDVVLHYYKQAIWAVGTVTHAAVPAPRPPGLPADLWGRDGRLVRVTYNELETPVARTAIPHGRRADEPGPGPFDSTADHGVKLGYLWPLSSAFAEWFLSEFGKHEPQSPVPPEALDDAHRLLRRLLGVPIYTVTGSENTILEVGGKTALVATRQSRQGQPVQVADVQAALETLRENRSVTIDVDTVGYRSAFIGAVLLTLPGAIATGSPPVIRFATQVEASDENTVTFEGNLTRVVTAEERGEQAHLRQHLIGSQPVAPCALCGTPYPVRFLVAAHIKKRALCTDLERRDLAHVAMLTCVFGCDSLFELGYVAVDAWGKVITTAHAESELEPYLRDLRGSRVDAHSPATAAYFEWHRRNVFLA